MRRAAHVPRNLRTHAFLAAPADSRFLVAALLGMTRIFGSCEHSWDLRDFADYKGSCELRGLVGTTPAYGVSDIADTRVPERSNFYGVLNGRRWSVY